MVQDNKEVGISSVSQQINLIPGFEQLCLSCPYKDLYFTAKNQGLLIENLKVQLNAVTREMERFKSQIEEKNTE